MRVSVNNEVCNGIPSNKTVLKNGDIVNVDVTTNLNGYYSAQWEHTIAITESGYEIIAK